MSDEEKLGLHNLPRPKGATKAPKRKGRGQGSGLGKTAGRGQKGQRARSGGGVRPGFEGGQMPLIRRLPKRGFTNIFRQPNQVVNLRDFEKLNATEITPDVLSAAGLVGKADEPVKILATGDVAKAFTVKGCTVSKSARAKIEQAGGRIEA
ncbi:MAG: 50S ribosomal protein L15 [Gemmatimonadota bacterium]|nr:50S ribosomal protein L15 [Gemmatimonadota bacterium]MDH5803980.1 50S ribosomal protein L15 [Gemmatimonadota bacterium]